MQAFEYINVYEIILEETSIKYNVQKKSVVLFDPCANNSTRTSFQATIRQDILTQLLILELRTHDQSVNHYKYFKSFIRKSATPH